MSIHDKIPPGAEVGNYAAQITNELKRFQSIGRACAARIQRLVDRSGDKAGVCADLGTTTCQQVVDLSALAVTVANTHPPTGATAATAAIVQADVPT